MRFLVSVAALWLGSLSLSVSAAQWHYNGFVSQSVIATSDNNFFGRSDDSLNTDFRELALILNGSLYQSVDFSTQLLSRKAGSADDGSPRVDYGFVSWRFQEGINSTQSFSLGKVKVPFGFHNETRESPFGRQSIWVAQNAYPDRARNSSMTANELIYFGEFRNDDWSFGIKTGYGKTTPDGDELIEYFQVKADMENFKFYSSTKWNFQLNADYGSGRFRMAFSRMSVPITFTGSLRFSDSVTLNLDAVVRTYINMLSLEWNESMFSVSAELQKAAVNYAGLTVDYTQPDYRNYPEGAVVDFRYHVRPEWDIYLRYDANIFDKNDPKGDHFQTVTGQAYFTRFGYDRVIGAAYRPTPDWLFMAELHATNGTMWMTVRDMPADEELKRHWNMAAITAAWRF